MSRLLFVVNDWHTLSTADTTRGWIRAAAAHAEVFAVPADGLDLMPDGRILARGRVGYDGDPVVVDVDTLDAVVVRTNPGRDPRPWASALLLQVLQLVEDRGVAVFNRPSGLVRAASKLYLHSLPAEARPPTLVTRSEAAVRAFLAELPGPAVIKPVSGTHGADVFKLDGPQAPNLAQIVEAIVRQGPAMVQGFVPEATAGDVRVHLVNGRIFEVDGHPVIIRRVPPGDDFRSNVHLGGTPTATDLDAGLRRAIELVGDRLRQDGLWHVGLDVIGKVVVEVNAFAPGGLPDVAAFHGVDPFAALTEHLMAAVAER